MICDLTTIGEQNGWNVHRCAMCGRECKSHSTADKTLRNCVKMGLGDYVATAIELSGIGPLYRRIRGKKCGGCQQRQEALNELGKKVGL